MMVVLGVVSPKFVYKIAKEQMQILRLTTPKLHPKEQRSLFGDPGTEKRLRISDSGH